MDKKRIQPKELVDAPSTFNALFSELFGDLWPEYLHFAQTTSIISSTPSLEEYIDRNLWAATAHEAEIIRKIRQPTFKQLLAEFGRES